MQQFLGNRYPNDGNRANVPNVGTLPARVSCFFNLFARNLTLAPLSNWVTVLLPVGGASFVPITAAPTKVNPTLDFSRAIKKLTFESIR